MAKKKEIKKTPKTLSTQVECECGKEWERKEVMEDKTLQTGDTYTFKFLGKYTINKSGYDLLLKLTACPDCREVTRTLI